MRPASIERAPWPALLAIGAMASIVLSIGCGGEDRSASAEPPAVKRQCKKVNEERSEYVRVLCEFRDAAMAEKIYDAYGFAEYMPSSQRAAIHAFCLVVDRKPERLEAEALSNRARLADEIVVTAESEVDYGNAELGSMPSLRRSIAKLQTILGLESVVPDLSEDYARACY